MAKTNPAAEELIDADASAAQVTGSSLSPDQHGRTVVRRVCVGSYEVG